ncbi:MAG: RHH-type transcriptional regulator, proline utilization regulon repressor/proline dehydrogenase/delta 1-pyrroline-5-carboxylate dehydrogenase [Thiomicrorhabdus sp.]|nr:MAG: RHH-type transcriptional regulator, proline utilization regulon repressor/proline dehydrogenase/delta 1-pyrroline-5-carboxylate dehydrogenase [Thiomicrorhabdus sp.]
MRITDKTFDSAKALAASWQAEIEESRQADEIKFHAAMQRMLQDPLNKTFLIELLDQSFRSGDSTRVTEQLEYIFSKYQHTSIFSHFEELLVWSFRHLGVYLPELSIPLFIKHLRNDIGTLVIKGENAPLNRHLKKRHRENTRINVNFIGESVLGEEEASARIQQYITALEQPNIDYLSIKISTIFSQIVPLAHHWSVNEVSKRLEVIYDAAIKNTFTNAKGETEAKFINLDMEEYRDVDITIDVLIHTLSKKKFHSLKAGIVLQAYLPDSLGNLKKLQVWAKQRVENGGSPIKVRLVKGANQEMELTEASLRDWPCTTYLTKAETDANYKCIMDFALDGEVTPYINIGIASHNLFDQALALLLAKQRGVEAFYTVEMLEGMSEAAYQHLKSQGLDVILYAPIATNATFTNAIAYLVRRFDESTAQQNYLCHSFGLKVNSPAWITLQNSYEEAIKTLPNLRLEPYRTQDRNNETNSLVQPAHSYLFKNESDTDFALPTNIKWAESIRDKWQHIGQNGGFNASPVIGGQAITFDSTELENDNKIEVIDKSQYHNKVIVGSYNPASAQDLQKAVAVAKDDPDGWRDLNIEQRQTVLMKVAVEFKEARADLIGIAAAEVGKVFTETDVEISEAIDFLNFYPYSAKKLAAIQGLEMQAKGVGLVVSPWNFPIAIPVGGVAAALAAGNTVILKPASDSVLCAYRLCECFWAGGVSQNTLQFAPCPGQLAGQHLVSNPDVNFVIFTGSEDTAQQMIKSRPDIQISAETGGKDATIVTALSDRDQAVKNVIASAFNNSGQKCSATSLLVLEREVYEDENFKKTLIDAAASLTVGSVWDLHNKIGSLANLPSGKLEKALSYLDQGEEWALAPTFADENPYLLKPAIRYGTNVGDFCHQNELFGPVLSVMCADNLEHAIEIVNATGYGLTSGLESLDEREQQLFTDKLKAGNLYLNRVTTGAIVTRQPFGGMGKSAIGSGKKAGGFNYITQFMNLSFKGTDALSLNTPEYLSRIHSLLPEETTLQSRLEKAMSMSNDFSHWLNFEFSEEHDYCHIRGESNILRYLPVKSVLFRFEENDVLEEILSSIAAAKMVGATVQVSIPKEYNSIALTYLEAQKEVLLDHEDRLIHQDENELIQTLASGECVERIRLLNPENVSKPIYKAITDKALYIASAPFIPHGRIELMHYYIEQSISNSYHRYGNLGIKGFNAAKETKA